MLHGYRQLYSLHIFIANAVCRYVDVVKDVETKVYTLNYELNGAFSNVKSKNIIGLMKKNQVRRK